MRDVERAAAEVEDQHGLLALLVEPVSERRGGRLVDDAQHLEPGDLAGVLGRLALRVVEVGGHGDDRLGDASPRYFAGVVGELAQDQGGDLLGRVLLAADLEAHRVVRARHDLVGDDLRLLVDLAPLAADEPLDGVDGRLRIEDRLALGHLPDEPLAVLGERHDRRRRARPSAFGITSAWPPSMVAATTEFVVPRSMPTALAMSCSSSHRAEEWTSLGCWARFRRRRSAQEVLTPSRLGGQGAGSYLGAKAGLVGVAPGRSDSPGLSKLLIERLPRK